MKKITDKQRRRLFSLLKDFNLLDCREEVISGHTLGRTGSVAEMTEEEAKGLIVFFEEQGEGKRVGKRVVCGDTDNGRGELPKTNKQERKEQCEKLVRKLLAKFHSVEWHVYDAEKGTVVYKNGRRVLDYARINRWCVKHTPSHLPFAVQSVEELQDTVTIASKMEKQFQSKIQIYEEDKG